MRAFYQFQQGPDESFDDFFERFDAQISTLETVGGILSLHPEIAQQIDQDDSQTQYEDLTEGQRAKVEEKASEAFLATAYLQASDPLGYARLVIKVELVYLLHKKPWPQTLQ
jgi:hypothetical protein